MTSNLPARQRVPLFTRTIKEHASLVFGTLTALCLLLVGSLIFRDFLFGDAVLLYKDIGSDSLNSYYPDFVHLSSYLRNYGFPSWSFYVGMGQDLCYATGFLIWQPVSWLPKNWIAHSLVFQHLAKILLVGLFFFRFLQLRNLRSPAPLLGAMLLSFSAYMCMGSCWYPLADEVVCFTGILLAIEEVLKSGRWLFLALAVALVGMITPFHLYLCALLLLFYVPLRLLENRPQQLKSVLLPCLRLAAVAALGLGLGAIVTLPYLHAILSSPRGSGTTSAVAALSTYPLFGLESARHYATAILRVFANDMVGVGDNFHGWQNYLEAPITYCGLICLLLFPQLIIRAPRHHAIILTLFLAGVLIPTVFPWFRYLFWFFQGDYYRTHSLFSIIGLIALSMVAFSRYAGGRPFNLWVLAATELLLLGILYFPSDWYQALIDSHLRHAAAFFLLSIGLLLAAGQVLKRNQIAASLIVVLAAIELVTFDRITVSNRKTVSKQELNARVGYNDETAEAVRDVKAGDESFFRITKLRPSGLGDSTSLNDAMMFGYYGTSSYSSFNSVNYTNFLTTVGTIPPNAEANTRWSMGLADSGLLSAFACEKYLLANDSTPFQSDTHYEPVRRYGKDFLFRNKLFLPLGLTYNRYIDSAVFSQLSGVEKQEALLRAVVLTNDDESEKTGLSQLTVAQLQQDMRATPLPDVVEGRRKVALSLTSFDQSRIAGTVRLDEKGILVLQTPFDWGWRAFQNGQTAPVLKVNGGLLGVGLDPGAHQVELRYRNPVLIPALIVTIASFLLLAAALWRWPRLNIAKARTRSAADSL